MKVIFMIFKDNSYIEYAKYIKDKEIDVHIFNTFEEAIEKIPASNPGAIVSINYFSKSYDTAEEHLNSIRKLTGCKVYILSGTKPPTKFIQKADELRNITVKWGKEIDIDIENIPETEEITPETKVEFESEETLNDAGAEDIEEPPPMEELQPIEEQRNTEEPEPETIGEPTGEPAKGIEIEIIEEKNNLIENGPLDVIEIQEEPNELEESNFDSLPLENEKNLKVIALVEKDLEDELKKFSSRFYIKTAAHIEEVLQEIKNAAAVIFSASICEKNFESVKKAAKAIPKIIKLYAIDNAKLNQLVYGELETNGIKFFFNFEDIFEDIEALEPPEPEEKKEDREEEKEVEHKTGQNIIKNVSGALGTVGEILKTTKNIPKPVINFPSIKIPKLNTQKKEPEVKENNKSTKNTSRTFVERSKIMLFLSPLTTGKTEIASNVAAALSSKGIKTALVDLDLEKKGLLYNFHIFEREDIYKYRLLSLSLSEHHQLAEEPLKLSFKADKNLFVYTTHRDIEIPFVPKTLEIFFRYLKRSVDIIIVDVGKSLPRELIESLFDIESVEKYLVATQDLGVLNTIPYSLKWFGSFPAYYKDWNLVLNNYRPLKGLKDSEIINYFYDEDSLELRFEILNTFKVPYSNEVWERKTERTVSYGSDKSFDNAIDEIVENWMFGKTQRGGVRIEI